MGVKGLWRLLLPIGRRISIETLEGKILAIDASIWLTQFLKAMRDPDTGSIKPAAHLIGFFRRLCKLRFHGIRPVLVFDGATPEIKRRELQLRRQRREQLFANHASNTVQRMAKRILAAELKKNTKKSATIGAYAPGFNIAEEEKKEPIEQKEEKDSQNNASEKKKDPEVAQLAKDVPSEESQNFVALDEEWEEPSRGVSENDWGKGVVAVASEEEESDEDHSSDENVFDIHQVASLPSHARKDAIEDARRKQRMRSRREFMPVAAKPSEYSQTQLRNFLRSSRLNQQIQKMAVRAVDKDDAVVGERIASDATRRIIFTKDKQKKLPAPAKTAYGKNERSSSDDDEEYEWQDEDDTPRQTAQEGDGGFTNCSSSARLDKAVAVEIDEDSDETGGGGFIAETESDSHVEKHATARFHGGDNDESGGFLTETPLDARRAQELDDEVLARAIQDSELVDRSAEGAINLDRPRSRNAVIDTDAALAAQLQAEDDARQSMSSQVLHHNEDDSEDDVAWEDADENEDHGELRQATRSSQVDTDAVIGAQLQTEEEEIQMVSSPIDEPVGVSLNIPAATDDDSDDAIEWEDGDNTNHGEPPSQFQHDGKQHSNSKNPLGTRSASEGSLVVGGENAHLFGEAALQSEPRRQSIQDGDSKMPPVFERGTSDGLQNDFDQSEVIDATAAALEHAQATASNLTDWAGRAFRRAIAQHIEATGGSATLDKSPSKEEKYAHTTSQIIHPDDHHPDDSTEEHVGATSFVRVAEKSEHVPPAEQNLASVHPSSGNEFPRSQSISDEKIKAHDGPLEPLQDPLKSLEEQEVTLSEESKRQERDMDTVTDEMKAEVISLVQLFGIPYVEAPAEAEAQCAMLEELGLVDGIVTEDSDVFVFGGRSVYKNIFHDQKYVEAYLARDAENDLGLGRNALVALAMLLGGDYTDGVKGVGIVNGMEVLEAYDVSRSVKVGLGKFRQWLDGFDPAEAVGLSSKAKGISPKEEHFQEKHRSARTRWVAPKNFPSDSVLNAYMNPVVDKSRERFSWGTPDVRNLTLFCQRNMGWDVTETEKLVLPVIEKIESGSRQTRMESFFMKYEDDIKFAKVRSKRLRDVFQGIQNSCDDAGDRSEKKIKNNAAKGDDEEANQLTSAEPKSIRKKRKK